MTFIPPPPKKLLDAGTAEAGMSANTPETSQIGATLKAQKVFRICSGLIHGKQKVSICPKGASHARKALQKRFSMFIKTIRLLYTYVIDMLHALLNLFTNNETKDK